MVDLSSESDSEKPFTTAEGGIDMGSIVSPSTPRPDEEFTERVHLCFLFRAGGVGELLGGGASQDSGVTNRLAGGASAEGVVDVDEGRSRSGFERVDSN